MQGVQPRWRRLGVAWLVALVASAAFAVAGLPLPARATDEPAVSIEPPSSAIQPGDNVILTLNVSGASHVHDAHIKLTYDAAVVHVVDADLASAGVQVLPGPFPGDETQGAVLVNTASGGVIDYRYRLDGSFEVSGSGTVATVQFVGVADGNANLAWSLAQLRDADAALTSPLAFPAELFVGDVPTATPTGTATPEDEAPADTPTATVSAQASASDPPLATNTSAAPTATRTKAPTRTPAPTKTPPSTRTPRPTNTPRVAVATQGTGHPPAANLSKQGGAGGVQAKELPSAGSRGPITSSWRWIFFIATLMFGVAGWFFTWAMHHGDREVVLTDRFDRRRRRRQ